jgi:pimeloyl-ACP methyl ester carboxylesterase
MYTRSFRIRQQGAPELSLREWGSGEPAFVLIHGFGDGTFVWDEFAPRLAAFGRTIAIDLRGHGDSDWDPDARYDSGAHLADVNFAVGALGLKKLVVIGHSLGAEIAIRLTAQHPELVVGLIIVDFGPEVDRLSTAHIRKKFVSESRVYAGYREYADHLGAERPLISPEIRWAIARSALRPGTEGGYRLKRDPAMGMTQPGNADLLPPLWPMLGKIRCPVLVIRGIASSVLPAAVADRMAEVLHDGCLVSIKLAGHAVMSDNPEAFADAALSFIEARLMPQPAASSEI